MTNGNNIFKEYYMLSRNIEDHQNIGLNADWCISTYQLYDDFFIFDNEDDTFTLSKVDILNACHEEAYCNYYRGTFSECIDYFEALKGE